MKTNTPERSGRDAALKYTGMLMALFYMVLGMLILIRPGKFISISSTYSVPFACVLLAYSLFRGYTVYIKYFKKRGL